MATYSNYSGDLIDAICEALGYPKRGVQRLVLDIGSKAYPIVYVQFADDTHLLEVDWPGHLKPGQIKVVDIGKE